MVCVRFAYTFIWQYQKKLFPLQHEAKETFFMPVAPPLSTHVRAGTGGDVYT